MFPHVNTRDAEAVLHACRAAWETITSQDDGGFLPRAFDWVRTAFEGRHPDYERLDTHYHDFEHTLQGTLCLARLLTGWHRAGGQPMLDREGLRLALVAILLHDTGYLKMRGDHEGTGAKFTPIHVQRSAEFAARLLRTEGFTPSDIRRVQSMIRCTGVDADIRTLSFERPLDRLMGGALASADLLGQMAADDYVPKLPALFGELTEAAAHDPGPSTARIRLFETAEDFVRGTPAFWQGYVLPRLENDFEGVYRFLNDPWPDGPNEYVQRIESNLARIRNQCVTAAA